MCPGQGEKVRELFFEFFFGNLVLLLEGYSSNEMSEGGLGMLTARLLCRNLIRRLGWYFELTGVLSVRMTIVVHILHY